MQLLKEMITQKGCLLDYPYFKEQFKLIAIDLSKEQALYANRKTIPYYTKITSKEINANSKN